VVTDEIEALKEATRQAHAAVKDLHRETREAKALIASLVTKEVSARIDNAVADQLDDLGKQIETFLEAADRKVHARFDKIGDILLGEERGDAKPSIEELARARSEQLREDL